MSTAVASPDHRTAPRVAVERIVCFDLGEHNGGIISNISEGGLCFQAIAPIEESEAIDFWLSESGRRIGGKGRVVWTDETHKRGGLHFANLSVQAREQINGLITPSVITDAAPSGEGKHRYSNVQVRNSVAPAVSSERVIDKERSHGFWGGVMVGVLVSLLVASAYVHRRQIGEWLIVIGERLAPRSAAMGQPKQPPIERTPTMRTLIELGGREATATTTQNSRPQVSGQKTKDRPRLGHHIRRAPAVARTKHSSKQQGQKAVAPLKSPSPRVGVAWQ